ncbi:MAG: hypothetical protein P4L36_14760 [Holophaga sp.]|nr:hypothetical protein [Holophaga sp.]
MLLPQALWGQVPLDRMSLPNRLMAAEIVRRPDFTFRTETVPTRVRVATMEKLFDHPRVAAAMWRECQFAPKLYAHALPARGLVVDDANGLRGTLTLAFREPGLRVYLIEGRVEKWRMGNPFAVGAKMVVIYKYWEGSRGFQSRLQTWTTLDSALLGVVTRPFRKYIQRRQEEFMAYIMGNMAKGGEFAENNYEDFLGPIQREGDPVAVRQFSEIFKVRS